MRTTTETSPRRATATRLARRLPVLVAAVLSCLPVTESSAQGPGRFGVGVGIGSPGGLAVRHALREEPVAFAGLKVDAVSALFSFDLDGYLLTQVHLEREWRPTGSAVRFYAGPGVVTGIDDRRLLLGLGAVAGLRFFRGRTEIFMQAHPRLSLAPGRQAHPGGAVGFRIHP